MIKRPSPTLGMRHIALFVSDIAACEHFYVDLLGMTVEWRPDARNVYLTSGNDNLALHYTSHDANASSHQKLAHIGFIINTPKQVDDWFIFLKQHQVVIHTPPKTHRDGARSFYCYDPAKILVQLIYHPPLASLA